MKALNTVFALSLALLSQTVWAQIAWAEQVRVLAIESDAIPGTTTVYVTRDEASGKMTGLFAQMPERSLSFTLAQLQTPQVFKQIDGRNVVFFSIERDFDAFRGGHANMRFLHSGVSGSFQNFRINVEQQGTDIVLRSDPNQNDPESDANPYTSIFNYLFLNKNTFFGKVIGIDSVAPEMR